MAGRQSHGRRRRGGAQHQESDERWLLTYADMITLLMALFMVLFSISSVNISKYQTLQQSLKAAFSGNILPGGKSIALQGASANASHTPSSADVQALVPLTATGSGLQSTSVTHSVQSASASGLEAAAQQEAGEFVRIKHELDAYAKAHGFGSKVQTTIQRQGLVIRVLTDDLLFESAQASLNTRAYALLGEIAHLLNVDETHRIDVEGNTDNVPIDSGSFPSNWELSTARASTVVRFLIEKGVAASRLTAAGYADQRPIASDATAAGRARNRRVEIVMQRLYSGETEP
ncbi:MAG TPA: flagellar motor protein MotB [Solirubrobacteraceae bacterium]|jgi:chemotaxis protein MotB|nr:flagellar motor protein MotB [Solirubrobacteraceae bacterium]